MPSKYIKRQRCCHFSICYNRCLHNGALLIGKKEDLHKATIYWKFLQVNTCNRWQVFQVWAVFKCSLNGSLIGYWVRLLILLSHSTIMKLLFFPPSKLRQSDWHWQKTNDLLANLSFAKLGQRHFCSFCKPTQTPGKESRLHWGCCWSSRESICSLCFS